jgi:GTP cyclohydrolase I
VLPGTTHIVVLRDVPVATTCPHHLMPAIGTGTIAFAPRQRLIGLGILAELLDAFAHRLTLQEQIGESVVLVLLAELEPRWAACHLALQHGCLSARGERKQGAVAETLAFAGDESARQEALLVLGAPRS